MSELSQKQRDILNGLKWKYDKDLPYVPWEYTIIKCNKNYTNELNEFANMLYETAVPYVLDDNPYECFTCKKFDDYYYMAGYKAKCDCIGRTYTDAQKLKDIKFFLQSEKFEYKKGMSLNDIYNQLCDKRNNSKI